MTAPCHHDSPPRHLYDGEDRLYGVPGTFSVVRCSTCGLAYTLPRLSGAELGRYYPSDSYVPYQPQEPPSTLRGRLGAGFDTWRFSAGIRYGAFRALTKRPPGRLLDVGCGRGDLAAWFAERGWQVAGVEPAEVAARQASERGIDVHLGTLDDAPFEPASFDAVTFNHALEHVPDPVATLRQARELLRPGGLVAVSVPNFGAWQRRAFGTYWFPLDLPRHLQHYDRRSLPMLAREAGLEPREVRSSSLVAGLVSSVQYRRRGRLYLSHGATLRASYLSYPLVLLGDLLFREADCLHVVASRGDA